MLCANVFSNFRLFGSVFYLFGNSKVPKLLTLILSPEIQFHLASRLYFIISKYLLATYFAEKNWDNETENISRIITKGFGMNTKNNRDLSWKMWAVLRVSSVKFDHTHKIIASTASSNAFDETVNEKEWNKQVDQSILYGTNVVLQQSK